jgi:hypothetical protein
MLFAGGKGDGVFTPDRLRKGGAMIFSKGTTKHGAVEKYNRRGKHLGEFNSETGEQTKPADKTREVEP